MIAFARIAALFLLVLVFQPVLAAETPWDDDPESFRQDVLEHRRLEAELKSSLVKGLAAAVAARTANQDLFDVHHYDLDLDLNPTTRILTGTVITTAEVTGTSLSTLDLNLAANMTVLGATAGGAPVTTSRSGDVLTVNLDRSYALGETVVVTVSYSGNPAGEYFGWSSYAGSPMIWTLSEPFGARAWWPCKDLNTDKADSLDIRVTVPSSLIVASQGLLVSDTTMGSERTFHWKTNYPTATYLVSLAIHPYARYSDWYAPLAGGDPMEVQYFIYPSHVGVVEPTYDLTVPMIGAFAGAYGEYPFIEEKYGHAEFVWGGGMEHQTLTSMGGYSEDLISHELAHQWWGDMVTCADFGHIWLNEGFATWSEAYWAEHEYGTAVYDQYMVFAAYYGAGTIFVEDPLTQNIFDSNLSYNKGSWIVHMLRGVLGDADFFAGLQAYRAAFEYGSATTEQLRDVMESVSGQDLDAFFQQWIYGEYFPVYTLAWVPGPGAGEITVTIGQVQTGTGLFTMAIPLRIETDQGTLDVTVQNSQASENYVIPVTGQVASVVLDPDDRILCQVQTTVSNPSFAEGILLVNGVHWDTYGSEITSAYADRAFSGNQPFSFWDCFSEPAAGYPAELPAPLGHGAVPADILGNYSTVIWVGNNYNGDLAPWGETPVLSFLEAGGNLLLLSRMSASFLQGDLQVYAGVTWMEQEVTLGSCVAAQPGLVNIPFTGTQSWNDVFQPAVGSGSTLLFTDPTGYSGTWGTGVIAVPPAGGSYRSDGGKLAHIAGRPYRMDHAALRADVTFILENYFGEPYDSLSPAPDRQVPSGPVLLGANHPNPFNPLTVIPVSTPAASRLRLEIFDARGRLVRRLADEVFAAGEHQVRWDGQDEAGRASPSGVYFVRLQDERGSVQTRGMVLVR